MAEKDVKHFEDLPAKDILEFLSSPTSFTCTEKLDGSNIIVGRDSKGLYTRRDKKEKYYRVEDYETTFFTNYQKLALAAVLKEEETIKSIIDIDEEVGAEVLVGLQPNVVMYLSNNTDMATIVLFKEIDKETTLDSRGRLGPIEFRSVKKRSYTESETKESTHRYRICTIDNYRAEIDTTYFPFINCILCAKQDIAGQTLPVYEIIDWPLNRRHPAKFDKPWKEVKEEFKFLRKKYRAMLRDSKLNLVSVDSFFPSDYLNEGYVCTNGTIEFKLVDQDAFLKVKNFIWKYRDMIKEARKQAGEIATLEDVEKLRSLYLDILDKYQANIKDSITVTSSAGRIYEEGRTSSVKARDRSAFVTAFEELERIEREIRRNNRDTRSK